MNKSFQVFSFDVRKYSVYNTKHDKVRSNSSSSGGEWFHFPQRSNISITFFKFTSTKNINISIIWNGNTIDKTNISVLNKDIISVIAKYPAIGFKHTLQNETLVKRFQVSFSKESDFDDCVDCLENELKFPIDNRKSESSKNMANTSLFPESQAINPVDISSQIITNSNYASNATNVDNLLFYNSGLNIPASTNNIYDLNNSTNFTNNINSQRLIYDEGIANCFQESILEPRNLPAEYSQLITPSYNYLSLTTQPYGSSHNFPLEESENFLVNNNLSCLGDDKVALKDKSTIKGETYIFNFSDEKLKKLIKERLRDKDFVDFVVRLDKIIHEE